MQTHAQFDLVERLCIGSAELSSSHSGKHREYEQRQDSSKLLTKMVNDPGNEWRKAKTVTREERGQ